MKSPSDLVPVVPSELLAPEALPPDRHPVAVYLARLAPGSRPAQRGALVTLAGLLAPGVAPEGIGWHRVRYQHAAACRAALVARGLAPRTVNRVLAALRGVVREAWRLGLCSGEDFERVRDVGGVRGSRLRAGRALSRPEERALFEACDSSPRGLRDGALLALLLGGGLRRAEVVSLDLGDCEAGARAVVVIGKGDKQRRVPLPPSSAARVVAWVEVRGPEAGALLWPVAKGGKLTPGRLSCSGLAAALGALARRADVAPFTVHDGRRTRLTRLIESGVDLEACRRLAGHSSVTTTASYDRRADHALDREVDRVDVG